MDNGARVLVSGYSPVVKYVFVVWGFFAVAYFLWLFLFGCFLVLFVGLKKAEPELDKTVFRE